MRLEQVLTDTVTTALWRSSSFLEFAMDHPQDALFQWFTLGHPRAAPSLWITLDHAKMTLSLDLALSCFPSRINICSSIIFSKHCLLLLLI